MVIIEGCLFTCYGFSIVKIHRLCLEIPCGENGYPCGTDGYSGGTNGYPRRMPIHILWFFHCENPPWKSIEHVWKFHVGQMVIILVGQMVIQEGCPSMC